jgi:hypothetical protein
MVADDAMYFGFVIAIIFAPVDLRLFFVYTFAMFRPSLTGS